MTPVYSANTHVSTKHRSKSKQCRLPENLPTESILLNSAEQREHPDSWNRSDNERTEELDWVPGKFIKQIDASSLVRENSPEYPS